MRSQHQHRPQRNEGGPIGRSSPMNLSRGATELSRRLGSDETVRLLESQSLPYFAD